MAKNPLANRGEVRDTRSIPGCRRLPGEGHGIPLQYSCLENPHGQRSLVGHSPRGHKESDTTKATWRAANGTREFSLDAARPDSQARFVPKTMSSK